MNRFNSYVLSWLSFPRESYFTSIPEGYSTGYRRMVWQSFSFNTLKILYHFLFVSMRNLLLLAHSFPVGIMPFFWMLWDLFFFECFNNDVSRHEFLCGYSVQSSLSLLNKRTGGNAHHTQEVLSYYIFKNFLATYSFFSPFKDPADTNFSLLLLFDSSLRFCSIFKYHYFSLLFRLLLLIYLQIHRLSSLFCYWVFPVSFLNFSYCIFCCW